MTITDEIAGLSGAALGYIHNNVKGAVKGYALGKVLSKRRRTFSENARIIKRQKELISTYQKKKNMAKHVKKTVRHARKKFKRNPKRRSGKSHRQRETDRYPAVSYKLKKSVHNHRPKKVKVTRKFKEKVNKIIQKRDIPGYYSEINYLSFGNIADNTQAIAGWWGTDEDRLFTGNYFLNAASVLWNKKGFPLTSTVTTNPGLGGVGQYTRTLYKVNDSGNFNNLNTIIHVNNSYSTHKFRNNGQRTIELQLYETKLKAKYSDIGPMYSFGNALGEMVAQKINTENANVTSLGWKPTHCPLWTKLFNHECKKIKLEPGQEFMHTTQGPSDFDLDFAKMYNTGESAAASTYQDFQKWSVGLFFIAKYDLINGNHTVNVPAPGGRFEDTKDNLGTLLCETQISCKLQMPEMTGLTTGAAFPANQQLLLDNRKPNRIIRVNGMTYAGVGVRHDEEMPAVDEQQ